MKVVLSRRLSLLLALLVLAGALVLLLISLNPLSARFTKAGALLAAAVAWLGLLFLALPHRRLRWLLPGVTALTGLLLLLPARSYCPEILRGHYVNSLESYEDTPYFWGGESRRGIDCSGLIRCGMMDTLLRRGLRNADGGLVRQSLSLWWHDTSADALGKEHDGLTQFLFDAPSLNEADYGRLRPGDLAVTKGGSHILAYLGGGRWTQACPDTGIYKVIALRIPSDNSWFRQPVKLMRWTILAGD